MSCSNIKPGSILTCNRYFHFQLLLKLLSALVLNLQQISVTLKSFSNNIYLVKWLCCVCLFPSCRLPHVFPLLVTVALGNDSMRTLRTNTSQSLGSHCLKMQSLPSTPWIFSAALMYLNLCPSGASWYVFAWVQTVQNWHPLRQNICTLPALGTDEK